MNRKHFLLSLAVTPFIAKEIWQQLQADAILVAGSKFDSSLNQNPNQNMNSLSQIWDLPNWDKPMPAIFVGHGSPMNAIESNVFSQKWKSLGESLPKPTAIICISAHWETLGSKITAMEAPKTIHDFGGFPKELFEVQYPAPGNPALADYTQKLVQPQPLELDHSWGLDHGCWSVIKCMYPQANIPVLQLSLDRRKSPSDHIHLAQSLTELRKKGVLIISSGNIVHNLGMVAWDKMNVPNFGYDWAETAREEMKNKISSFDVNALSNPFQFGRAWELSIPTPEHYLPLLYTLSAKMKDDHVEYFNDQCVLGSLAMTSFLLRS